MGANQSGREEGGSKQLQQLRNMRPERRNLGIREGCWEKVAFKLRPK